MMASRSTKPLWFSASLFSERKLQIKISGPRFRRPEDRYLAGDHHHVQIPFLHCSGSCSSSLFTFTVSTAFLCLSLIQTVILPRWADTRATARQESNTSLVPFPGWSKTLRTRLLRPSLFLRKIRIIPTWDFRTKCVAGWRASNIYRIQVHLYLGLHPRTFSSLEHLHANRWLSLVHTILQDRKLTPNTHYRFLFFWPDSHLFSITRQPTCHILCSPNNITFSSSVWLELERCFLPSMSKAFITLIYFNINIDSHTRAIRHVVWQFFVLHFRGAISTVTSKSHSHLALDRPRSWWHLDTCLAPHPSPEPN